jgi:hypothetical protein
LIIIPFLKNTGCIPSEVKRIISALFTEKADIFALMVNEATNSIDDMRKDKAPCSEFVKQLLNIVRDPVKIFYKGICTKSHAGSIVTSKTLYEAYHG